MQTTRTAFQDCWLVHVTAEGQLRDKSKKEFKQYMDTSITTDGKSIDEKAVAIKDKLLKQSRESSKQADKEGKVTVACLKDVLVDPKAFPAFVSLSQLRKSSK